MTNRAARSQAIGGIATRFLVTLWLLPSFFTELASLAPKRMAFVAFLLLVWNLMLLPRVLAQRTRGLWAWLLLSAITLISGFLLLTVLDAGYVLLSEIVRSSHP